MQIRIPMKVAEAAIAKGIDNAYFIKSKEQSPLKRYMDFESNLLDRKALKILQELTNDTNGDYAENIDFAYRASKPVKSGEVTKITSIHHVKDALLRYVQSDKIKGYLFVRQQYNAVAPFLITKLTDDFTSSYRSRSYKQIMVELAWSTMTKPHVTDSFSVTPYSLASMYDEYGIPYDEETAGTKDAKVLVDVKPKGNKYLTAEQIFMSRGYYKETEELHELYDKQIARFLKFLPLYGQQFRVRGSASTNHSWWTSNQSMLTEGKPARCIVTTTPAVCRAEGDTDKVKTRSRYYDEDDDEGDNTPLNNELSIPLHAVTIEDMQETVENYLTGKKEATPFQPALTIFHLDLHKQFTVHVNNIVPYQYKDNLQDMLILPKEVKDLTQMLVAASSEDVEDVIEGKSQSTVLACVGDPGLGKTLLAEVMAEACRKPLYKIQAAQLGKDPDQLETNLTTILKRAEKWNCLVMIDEANAYIHARGHDIVQNAVVGVFLRKLEYFKGILILTTNQTRKVDDDDDTTDFDIDDAILSRCTAVFRFKLPSIKDAKAIWKLQANLLKVNVIDDEKPKNNVIGLSDELIDQLVKQFKISGRTIRHLLKLTARWAAQLKEPLTLEHFLTCAKYVPLTKSESIKDKETK